MTDTTDTDTDSSDSSAVSPAGDVSGRQCRTKLLLDSVMALRDACREYAAALRLAESGRWSVDLGRVRGVSAQVRVGTHTSPRPHSKALFRIGDVFTNAVTELEWRYEAATLAYAYGATWATRAVLDGGSPAYAEFTGSGATGELEHPWPTTIPIATTDGQDVAQWVQAPELAAAREALDTCLAAGGHGDELAARDYLADHEAGEMHRAWDVARGTAEAAYAYGQLAEDALQYALNVVRRS